MFFQVDDKLHVNLKITGMIETEGVKKAGPAMMLWTLAGSRAQDAGSDGVTTEGDIVRLTLDRREGLKAAQMLVAYQLWHGPGHDCDKCPPVAPGTYRFHDWFQFGYDTGEQAKVSTAKRKELKDEQLRNAVWARDSIEPGVALCRYCGHKVARSDRKSDRRPHLDHVDPTRAIGPTNVVVACGKCNQAKYNRTPEQAGMTLRPPPDPGSGSDPESDLDQTEIRSDSGPDQTGPRVPRGRAREGAGLVGSGRGRGSGSSGSGTGSAGRGRGEARGPSPGRAGAVPEHPAVGRWGSPWKGWSGPPPSDQVLTESTCPDHGMPEPCRKCPADQQVEAARGSS